MFARTKRDEILRWIEIAETSTRGMERVSETHGIGVEGTRDREEKALNMRIVGKGIGDCAKGKTSHPHTMMNKTICALRRGDVGKKTGGFKPCSSCQWAG